MFALIDLESANTIALNVILSMPLNCVNVIPP